MGEEKPRTKVQEDMLARMKFAFTLMTKGYPRQNTAAAISNQYNVTDSQAYRIINETIKVVGDVWKSSKDGLKAIHYENFTRLGKKAEEDGDFLTAQACYDKAARLMGLYESSFEGLAKPEDYGPNGKFVINFFADAKALEARQVQTIDITYEDDNGVQVGSRQPDTAEDIERRAGD